MEFLAPFINQHEYIWVPIVAFVVITIIAGLIGFWNGWKTSLYFFGWNLVGVIVGVFVTSPIMKGFDGIGILKVVSGAAEATWGLLILFVFMLGINFLAFLFYWIFRSKLKKSMKDNKKAKKSNLSSRFIGMGIAITSASPAAFFLADATAVMSPENGFTKFTDAMARAYTGGKYDGTAEDRNTIDVLSDKDSMDAIKHLADAIGGSGDKDELLKNKEKIEDILNTNVAKNIDSIYDGLKSSQEGMKDVDLKNVSVNDITGKVPKMGIKFDTTEKQQQFNDAVTKLFKNNGQSDDKAKKLATALIEQLTAKVTP